MNAPEDINTSEINTWIDDVEALTKINLDSMFTVMDYLSNKFLRVYFFYHKQINENGWATSS